MIRFKKIIGHFKSYPLRIHLTVVTALSIVALVGVISYLQSPPVRVEAQTAQVASNPLPFNMPSQSTLKASGKKVFAHYFSQYPISEDNVDPTKDYYQTNYLAVNGENGIHAAYGGFLRERPLPRAVISTPDWQVQDMKTEVQRATNAGLDGFTYDMLGLNDYHWDHLQNLLKAAPVVDSQFKIILMPDATTSVVSDVNQLAAKIASVASSSAIYKLNDGRLVISPFKPEDKGANWWANLINILKVKYGIQTAFVPCFLNYASNADSFASISYGYSNWGNRSPSANTNIASLISDAHKRGKIWMQPLSVQDNRPKDGLYWEANNTENLRATWNGAIGGADWIQIPTWNDYSENTEISPSTHIGYGPLDISSYYLAKYKTGQAPNIVRDVVYVSHRVQSTGLKPNKQTKIMTLAPGSDPARNMIEILSFLTAPATINLRVGSMTYSYSAPAGLSSKTYPIVTGDVSTSVSRNGSKVTDVNSKFPIVSVRDTQDLAYYFVSSGRDGYVYNQGPSLPSGTPLPSPSSSASVPPSGGSSQQPLPGTQAPSNGNSPSSSPSSTPHPQPKKCSIWFFWWCIWY